MYDFNIVGLAGKIGSGKDYVAKHTFKPLGFKQWAFAWPLKIAVLAENPEFTWNQVFVTKPSTVRTRLQLRGTEEGRNKYGEDVWVRATDAYLTLLHEEWGINDFVLTDVRFPNEAEYIKSQAGLLIKVHAPVRQLEAEKGLKLEHTLHASETALDGYEDWDIVYNNDPESTRLANEYSVFIMTIHDWIRQRVMGNNEILSMK